MVTVVNTLTPLSTPAPNRSMAEDVYAPAADTFAAEITQFVNVDFNARIGELNTLAAELNALSAGSVYGLKYTYSSATTATDPTAGKLKFDNATLAAATKLYLSETDYNAVAQGPTIQAWDDPTNVLKGLLRVIKAADPTTFAEFQVNGAITDNGAWDTLNVVYQNGHGTIADTDLVVLYFERYGADGLSATFVSPTRTITGSGNITSADNGYLLDITAGGATLTLDTPAGLGAGFSCTVVDSPNAVTLAGTFNDGATSKAVPARCTALVLSDGVAHRLYIIEAAAPFGQCVLVLSGANLLLKPRNGNRLTVNGVPCIVPDAGVSLAPAGLAAGTRYYIYATQANGVINALEASTTGHSTDTSANNKGVEIKTGDSTRTLVGMAYCKTAATFADSSAQRFIRSWFNESGIQGSALIGSSVAFGSSPWSEISPSYRAELLLWAGELVEVEGGVAFSDASGGSVLMYGALGIDTVTSTSGRTGFGSAISGASNAASFGCSFTNLVEGYHFFATLGGISGGVSPTYTGGYCGLEYTTKR